MKSGFAFAQASALSFVSKKRSITIALRSAAFRAARPRCFAIDNIRSAVYGQTLRIMKDNFAPIRNFRWIDSTMSLVQPCAVPSCIRA